MNHSVKYPADTCTNLWRRNLRCRPAVWGGAVLLAVFCLVVGRAQEPQPGFLPVDSLRQEGFVVPDSLGVLAPWTPDFRSMEPIRTSPLVSMASVVEIQLENRPRHIVVIDNNTLRLGRYFNLSNGQAWHWGPFLNAYLDARTLSFPMPR